MKIMLVCYGGLSTSMLVNDMKKVAAENEKLEGKEIEIVAWGKEEYYNELDGTSIILLGPQVSMLEGEVRNELEKKKMDIPVAVISKELYGEMNGEAVLVDAFLLLKKYKEGSND